MEKKIILPKLEQKHSLWNRRWVFSQVIALLFGLFLFFALVFALETYAAPTFEGRIMKSLRTHLLKDLPKKYEARLVIQRYSAIPEMTLPEKPLVWEWKGPDLLNNGPRSVYQLTIGSQDGWATKISVNVSVRLKLKIYKAKETIPGKVELVPSLFSYRETEITPRSIDSFINGPFPKFVRARGVIPKAAPLSIIQLEKIPIIKRGSLIDLVIRQGGLAITTQAEAKQDGHLKETIQVKTMQMLI